MINIEYGKQSDQLILVQGNDYIGSLSLKFQGLAGTWESFVSAKLAIFEFGFCAEETATQVYITDAAGFVTNVDGEPPAFDFILNRTDSSGLDAGARRYGYEVSGQTLDGAITRICWGFVSVQESVL